MCLYFFHELLAEGLNKLAVYLVECMLKNRRVNYHLVELGGFQDTKT